MFKVLIVDDSPSIHRFIANCLKSFDKKKVVSVFDGVEALELLGRDRDFDVILLDWEMPRLNGPDTLKKLNNLSYQIPVVMMTTKNSPFDIVRMLTAGTAEYAMKPFTEEILIEKIERVCGAKGAHAG